MKGCNSVVDNMIEEFGIGIIGVVGIDVCR